MSPPEAVKLAGLYALTPDWPDTDRLLAVTEAILAGGCRLFQYRNKSAAAHLKRTQLRALRGLTAREGAALIVNDDWDLARFAEADGVHLGRDDGDPAAARAALGPRAIIGVSCYQSLVRALAAQQAGASYVAFGSFFASRTKPQALPADPGLLRAAGDRLALPITAIGGITPDNGVTLVAAGADMLAVISALYQAPDPGSAALAFNRLFSQKGSP
jgi:thiamine-phosphate pyrophosphorylase